MNHLPDPDNGFKVQLKVFLFHCFSDWSRLCLLCFPSDPQLRLYRCWPCGRCSTTGSSPGENVLHATYTWVEIWLVKSPSLLVSFPPDFVCLSFLFILCQVWLMKLREVFLVGQQHDLIINFCVKSVLQFGWFLVLRCPLFNSSHRVLSGKDPGQHTQAGQRKMAKSRSTAGIPQYIPTQKRQR